MNTKERVALKKDLKKIESGDEFMTTNLCNLKRVGVEFTFCSGCCLLESGLCKRGSGLWEKMLHAVDSRPEDSTQFINGCYALLNTKEG